MVRVRAEVRATRIRKRCKIERGKEQAAECAEKKAKLRLGAATGRCSRNALTSATLPRDGQRVDLEQTFVQFRASLAENSTRAGNTSRGGNTSAQGIPAAQGLPAAQGIPAVREYQPRREFLTCRAVS